MHNPANCLTGGRFASFEPDKRLKLSADGGHGRHASLGGGDELLADFRLPSER